MRNFLSLSFQIWIWRGYFLGGEKTRDLHFISFQALILAYKLFNDIQALRIRYWDQFDLESHLRSERTSFIIKVFELAFREALVKLSFKLSNCALSEISVSFKNFIKALGCGFLKSRLSGNMQNLSRSL